MLSVAALCSTGIIASSSFLGSQTRSEHRIWHSVVYGRAKGSAISHRLEGERVRLPFPERVPLRYAVGFAAFLCVAQLIQGTTPLFSLCAFCFIVVATITFNFAGGFTRASGGYVFFYAILAVILGLFWKACIGEPADSNLTQPILTMEAALGGITAMFMAVFVSQKLTTKRVILADMGSENFLQASIGCMIAGLSITAALIVVPHESGSVLSALGQLNGFLPLAMILGVIYQVRKSGGTQSVNLPVLISGAGIFFLGLLGFSKEGIFTPVLCWVLAAASQRYKVSFYQAIGLILALSFMVYYLVPYSQYGRNFRGSGESETGAPIDPTEAFWANVDVAVSLLSHLEYVREQFQRSEAPARIEGIPAYFDTPQGFFDRLQMMAIDDAIINVTEERGPFGLSPIVFGFENFVPHFLWPGKPTIGMGNLYAHEIGMIGPEDFSTGVSFSPIGEAYHLARWSGIFILAPVLWILLFTLFDSLCGDVRKNPWGLLVLVMFGHVAPEGGLGSIMYMLWYGAINVTFASLAAVYVMPLIGSILTASKGTKLRRIAPVRSIPRRVAPIPSSRNPGQ
jgi:hypothetical protein